MIFEAGGDCNPPQPKMVAISHPRMKSLHAFVTFFILHLPTKKPVTTMSDHSWTFTPESGSHGE
jgi:hypothetical protein